jgi:tetratricopeptide (TPR) repeat protein
MDENLLQAYLKLIQALLDCPIGEEAQILVTNWDVVDYGLVQTAIEVAEELQHKGDINAAYFLISIAYHLAQALGLISSTPKPESQFFFLMLVLEETSDCNGNPQRVYKLLQDNLELLDDNFAAVLQSWASTTMVQVELRQAQYIAAVICNFSNLMQQFSFGNRARSLEIAIAGYEIVTTIYTREAFPENWAMIQNNLGIAYDRINKDRVQNLEDAIRCFNLALQVYTREAFPEDWAAIQNNLGIAYTDRIKGYKAENIESAIDCFNLALQIYTYDIFPENWATTQYNLGIAYSERIEGGKAENIEAAIDCYNLALAFYTREAFPEDWAATQNNLGIAYGESINKEIETAISCYNLALEVYTREAFPENWAATQYNLGVASRQKI